MRGQKRLLSGLSTHSLALFAKGGGGHSSVSAGAEDSDGGWTPGQRRAGRRADFVGTWTFLFVFTTFVLIWIAMNSLLILWRPADPYPFIFLNLVLSAPPPAGRTQRRFGREKSASRFLPPKP